MKISPVQGLPTITNPSPTGLSPEKLMRIKAIANNETPPEVTEEKEEKEVIALGETPTAATKRIKMNVNQTIHRNGDLPISEATESTPVAQEAEPAPEGVQPQAVQAEMGVSDPSVEAQSTPGATRVISPELAELAREKRALQVKERELLEKEKALKAEPEGYIKIADLQNNVLGTLQKHGFDNVYQKLTDEILGQQSQPDLNQFKEEILKSVEEKLAGKDSQQEQAVYDYMRTNMERMQNLPQYRIIKELGLVDKSMELVKRMWTEEGEILDEAEAMELIKEEALEDARRYARLVNGEKEPEQEAQEAPPVAEPKTKTLTNKDSARPVLNRRARAIAAMLGQKI